MAVKKTVPLTAEADQEPEPPPPGPHAERDPDPGWWRNVGETPLDVVGDGVGKRLAPGEIAWLPWAGTHRDLAPATRAEFDAQQKAEASAEAPVDEPPGLDPDPEASPAEPAPTQSQE